MSERLEKFKKLARTAINREGLEDLLLWLDTTDIEKAPASTMFHGNYAGGLLDHSMNVYQTLLSINANTNLLEEFSAESLAIVALFHDLCKIEFYSIGTRNVKNETTGCWEKKPFYKKDEKLPFGGHGSKSLYLVMRFMFLNQWEASAINTHMGSWDHQDYGDPGAVFQQNKLAWCLHVADEYATYYLDKQEV